MEDYDMRCVDLRKLCGERFQITLDEAAPVGCKDPWMYQVVGRFGTIYPHGGALLAAEVDGHPAALRKLLALGLTHYLDGEPRGENTLLFDCSLLEQVCSVVQPRERKRLNPEAKAKLVEAGVSFQYGANRGLIEANSHYYCRGGG